MFAILICSKLPMTANHLHMEKLWLTDTIIYHCLKIIILSKLKQRLSIATATRQLPNPM